MTSRIINGRHYVPALQAQHDINAARAERDALRAALSTARGYMMNAAIDLETGTKKATTLATLNGGIQMIKTALGEP